MKKAQVKKINTTVQSNKKNIKDTNLFHVRKKKKMSKRIAKAPLTAIKTLKKNYEQVAYAPRHVSIVFRIFIITLAALIVTFALDFFIHPAKLYSGGLRGIQQIILYAVPYVHQNQWLGYVIFFAMNVPLAYFGFKYIGVKFTILTLYFIIIQSLFSYIMELDEIRKHIEVFPIHQVGETITKISSTGSVGHLTNTVTNNHIVTVSEFRKNTDRYLAGIIGAFIYGIGIALTFVAGASSGGTKFIVAWINKKFGISLGKVGIYIAIFVVTLGISINSIALDSMNPLEAFLSVKLFATAVFITIQNMFINVIAPRTKRTKIEIQTSQSAKVKKIILGSILDTRTWYSYKILKNENKKFSSVFVLVVDKRESAYVLRRIHNEIPNAYITAYDIKLKTKDFQTRNID